MFCTKYAAIVTLLLSSFAIGADEASNGKPSIQPLPDGKTAHKYMVQERIAGKDKPEWATKGEASFITEVEGETVKLTDKASFEFGGVRREFNWHIECKNDGLLSVTKAVIESIQGEKKRTSVFEVDQDRLLLDGKVIATLSGPVVHAHGVYRWVQQVSEKDQSNLAIEHYISSTSAKVDSTHAIAIKGEFKTWDDKVLQKWKQFDVVNSKGISQTIHVDNQGVARAIYFVSSGLRFIYAGREGNPHEK